MTKPSMKPFDPEHKGEFCYENGNPARILCTDAPGATPIKSLGTDGLVIGHASDGRSPHICGYDLMCVIPKREARVIILDDDGDFRSSFLLMDSYRRTKWREVLPDDISQEKARAVIDAARAFLKAYNTGIFVVSGPCGDAIETLHAALGDDA